MRGPGSNLFRFLTIVVLVAQAVLTGIVAERLGRMLHILGGGCQ